MAAALAVYIACFQQHRLARGEVGMVLVLAASRDQASVVLNYVKAFLEASPILRQEIVSITRSEITLRNGIVISVHSNSFRTVRGRTLIACIFDEVAYWRDEQSAMPDVETYRAILPSLATTNGMLIGISTPYRKLGLLHQKHKDIFGVDDDEVLVVQGSTKQFNPSLSDRIIETQRQADPTAASSEWDAEFRSDIASLFDDQLIDAAVEHGRPLELPPVHTLFGSIYKAFTDPAVVSVPTVTRWPSPTRTANSLCSIWSEAPKASSTQWKSPNNTPHWSRSTASARSPATATRPNG